MVDLLIEKIGHGKIVTLKEGNYLEFTTYAGLYHIVENGYFRTPKLEAQNRLIDFLNIRAQDFQNNSYPKKEHKVKDLSPITSNGWQAGLIDADGNFNVIIAPRKNSENIRIQAQFRLELRQTYHRSFLDNNLSTSYQDIMSIIANYLGVNVYNRARILNTSMTYQYYFVAGSFTKIDNKIFL